MTTTPEQQKAIDEQAAVYGTDQTTCGGLDHYTVDSVSEWTTDVRDEHPVTFPADAVAVLFHYVIPADGENRPVDGLGLEVTVFAADGSVLDSQDFG